MSCWWENALGGKNTRIFCAAPFTPAILMRYVNGYIVGYGLGAQSDLGE